MTPPAASELLAAGLAKEAYLEQLFTFGNPSRDPGAHVISVAYLALLASPRQSSPPADKYLQGSWFWSRPCLSSPMITP